MLSHVGATLEIPVRAQFNRRLASFSRAFASTSGDRPLRPRTARSDPRPQRSARSSQVSTRLHLRRAGPTPVSTPEPTRCVTLTITHIAGELEGRARPSVTAAHDATAAAAWFSERLGALTAAEAER